MIRRSTFGRLAAAAVCLGGSVAYRGVARAQAFEKIRVVVIPTEIPTSLINANALGYFKDAGLAAEVVTLSNGAAATAAVLSSAADIAFSNTMSLVVAHDKGLPARIVIGTDLHRSANPVQGILAVLSHRR